MQVFKAYFKIVRKKLTSVIIYMVIFILLMMGLSMLGGESEEEKFTKTSLDIAVENLDEGKVGEALVDYLELHNVVYEAPGTEDEVLDAIFSRKYDYVLFIPKDFTNRFLAGEREGLLLNRKVPSSATGSYADGQIDNYMRTLGMYIDGGFSIEEGIEKTQENLDTLAKVEFVGNDGGEKDQAVYFLQYLPYIFISTIIMLVGPILLIFQKKDMDARNKCSATSFFNRNMQLVGASVLIMLIDYVVLMTVICLLCPEYMSSVRGVLAVVNTLLMALIALALTYVMAQIVKKEDALSAVSNVFGLGFSFLGGVFVPMEIFSDGLLVVSKFTPTYWYVIANDAIDKVGGFADVPVEIWQSFAMEGIFAVAFLALGMLLNRMKARE